MGCKECGKPKCNGECGCKSPKVLQINNPAEYITFHKVSIPAAMGDSTTNPPKIGAYRNALVYYEADHTSWLYSTDGIPTKLTNGLTDYNEAINLPQINGHTLIGDQSSSELDLQGELTAGTNIQINGNVISATDTTYTAGNGIELDGTEIKAKIGDGLEFDNDGEINIADIEQYAHFFDTVADMKAADLSAGEFAITAGYYAVNDGGGAKYKIVNSSETADGGSVIVLDNNLKAELILTDPINVKTFGAYGDGTHDDTTALQNALDKAKKVYLKGIYKVSSTININCSIDMDGNSYIKADNSLTTKVVLIAPNYKVGCTYNVNVDASGVTGIGIAVGSPRKAILNLNVINAGTTGIDCNNLSSTGNNENEFKCNVIGNSSGTTVTGVLCNCFDSIFSSITTQDCQRGVEVNNGELIATSVHSWLSDTTASSLWSNSCVVYNPSYYNTEIEWLYQDSVKYGYLCNGAYGHIDFLEYNNTLTDHSTLYNDYTNVKSTGGAVRLTIDNYKNAIDENSYLKYDISQTSSSEFGVTNKNGVASILSAVQSKLPFSDANDAPQWGTFSCPYTITNMGSSTNGVLKCEVVGYYAVQKFYRDDFTDVPREYIRMRKLGTSTWTDWKYYSPAG